MDAETTAELAVKSSLFSDVMGAGITVQALLLILVVMSVVSWAVILKKRKLFAKTRKDSDKFFKVFWSFDSLDQVKSRLDEKKEESPLSRIFNAGFFELERVRKRKLSPGFALDNLEKTLRREQDQEISFLEDKMVFLATTGSTAPFIGLLGTVIGIMNSFRAISNTGSASLSTVAPGISEALFATAIGLFAAIPAVMAYNYLLNEIRKEENNMNNFISSFLNMARLEMRQN